MSWKVVNFFEKSEIQLLLEMDENSSSSTSTFAPITCTSAFYIGNDKGMTSSRQVDQYLHYLALDSLWQPAA